MFRVDAITVTRSTEQIAQGLTLLIPAKPDRERDAVAHAFVNAGGAVLALDRFWEPPALEPISVRVYGPDTFCLVLQQKLGLVLDSPPDDALLRLPDQLRRRAIHQTTLGALEKETFPSFVKPVMPKQFRAGVFSPVDVVRDESRGLTADTSVMISEVVNFTAEVRTFVLGGRVLDGCLYEGTPKNINDAWATAELAAQAISLPPAVVIDVGYIEDRGWAVIEFNAVWGAGLNGCDPRKVLPAILNGTRADH